MTIFLFCSCEVTKYRFLETIECISQRVLCMCHNAYMQGKSSKVAKINLILVIPVLAVANLTFL